MSFVEHVLNLMVEEYLLCVLISLARILARERSPQNILHESLTDIRKFEFFFSKSSFLSKFMIKMKWMECVSLCAPSFRKFLEVSFVFESNSVRSIDQLTYVLVNLFQLELTESMVDVMKMVKH